MNTMFARWVDRMSFVAFGTLRLSMAQFEAMTPAEFGHALRAESERETRQKENFAALACWVLSAFGSKVQIRDLIHRPGERRRQRPDED